MNNKNTPAIVQAEHSSSCSRARMSNSSSKQLSSPAEMRMQSCSKRALRAVWPLLLMPLGVTELPSNFLSSDFLLIDLFVFAAYV